MRLRHHFQRGLALFVLVVVVDVYAAKPARFDAAVAPDGTVLRVDRASGTADRLVVNGDGIVPFPLPFKVKKHVRIAFSGGHVFMSLFDGRRVYELNRSGKLLRNWKFPAGIHDILVDAKRVIAFPTHYRGNAVLYWEMDRGTGKVRKYRFKPKTLVGNRNLGGKKDRKAILMGLSWGAACLDGPDIRYIVPATSELLRIRENQILGRQEIPLPVRIHMAHSRGRFPTTSAYYDSLIHSFFPVGKGRFLGMYMDKGKPAVLFLYEDHRGILTKKEVPGLILIGIYNGKAILMNEKNSSITCQPLQ